MCDRNRKRMLIGMYLLNCAEEGSATLDWKFLVCCCEMFRLLDDPPPGTAEADGEGAMIGIAFAAWPFWPSTCFLERWRPRFMCRSQYFPSATASLEQRHFFPSVRRHLPGSGSVFPEKPRYKDPHPTAITSNNNNTAQNFHPDGCFIYDWIKL